MNSLHDQRHFLWGWFRESMQLCFRTAALSTYCFILSSVATFAQKSLSNHLAKTWNQTYWFLLNIPKSRTWRESAIWWIWRALMGPSWSQNVSKPMSQQSGPKDWKTGKIFKWNNVILFVVMSAFFEVSVLSILHTILYSCLPSWGRDVRPLRMFVFGILLICLPTKSSCPPFCGCLRSLFFACVSQLGQCCPPFLGLCPYLFTRDSQLGCWCPLVSELWGSDVP